MAAATNTGVVLLTADPNERPAVIVLPAQIMTLEALMHASEAKEQEAAAAVDGKKSTTTAAPPPPPASKGAQGFTYVMATQGKLWSTALRMESKLRYVCMFIFNTWRTFFKKGIKKGKRFEFSVSRYIASWLCAPPLLQLPCLIACIYVFITTPNN